MLCFGIPDLKRWLSDYITKLHGYGLELLATETELRWLFEHDSTIFANFPDKHRRDLSAWALATALRHQLITPSVEEGKYILPNSLVKKPIGRPKKTE